MQGDVWQAEPQAQELESGKWVARLAITRQDSTGVSERLDDLPGEYESEDEALRAAQQEIKRRSPA